ncbi:MAG: hypothetical protein BWZ00_01228 [Bacteroidetes bacterium ADurb.BinA174]|nr:MAG: hypothetical protein BWZ00_01228 [Bacteroidetes bacterium ADurb.BinA174]
MTILHNGIKGTSQAYFKQIAERHSGLPIPDGNDEI